MGYGVNEKGKKMSKSEGRVIDPLPILHKYGADTFRFWSASEVNIGYDFTCSEQRIASAGKFLSKLWNIGRFISSFDLISEAPISLVASDRWILSELSKLNEECKKGYDVFNFFIPANAIREFMWNLFAPHYLEMVKGRTYDIYDEVGRRSAIYTLHKCLSTILLLLAPICPFITEELWTKMYSSTSVHLHQMPKTEIYYPEMTKFTGLITNFNSMIWNKKKGTILKETGKMLSLKDSIDIIVPPELELFKDDLQTMHNLKK
jgi:valyl-tRNA synthetase